MQFQEERNMNQTELDQGRRRTLLASGTMLAGGMLGTSSDALAQQQGLGNQGMGNQGMGNQGIGNQQGFGNQQGGGQLVREIERILRCTGKLRNGVLSFDQVRRDLDNVIGPNNIPWRPSFEIRNSLFFQLTGQGQAICNCEFSLLGREANQVIDRITTARLVFQSFHHHFFDLRPQIWHIHCRGAGEPIALARAVAYVIGATGTPLPQTTRPNPSSSLNSRLLGRILGGNVEILEQGVVEVTISRREQVTLGGIQVRSELGLGHTCTFLPLGDVRTVVSINFALIAIEVNVVIEIMRRQGFTVHCLYNQETAETPQLYFSHQLAIGDPYQLALAVRRALNRTNTGFGS
jgi:Domain of Unknown Function (DUF1259)